MKVTKYVHSCLLVETAKQTVLIDPGNYTYDSHLLKPAALNRLDYLVITHEHPDHFHPQLLKDFCAKFPQAIIITNQDLAKKLKAEKLSNKISSGSHDGIEVFSVAHEPLPLDMPVPDHIGVHVEDTLTFPGDALQVTSRPVLALPLTAPWGSLKMALEAAVKLKPQKIIPVHDWHWQQQARQAMYGMSQQLLEPHNIEFIKIENAQPIEL